MDPLWKLKESKLFGENIQVGKFNPMGFYKLKLSNLLIEIQLLFIGGYLNGKGKVSLQNVDCTLEGNFVNGKLHGPVRGLTSKGKSV